MLRSALLGAGSVALSGCLLRGAAASQATAQPGSGPYGDLRPADGNGLSLPPGFKSRVVAQSGQPVARTGYRWHDAPDGGACFRDGKGWIYVSNCEIEKVGGASALRFAADGSIRAAYRILNGTNRNCAGGATSWNTWLSCEEVRGGQVWETDPWGEQRAVVRPAMGRFTHEAAAHDPGRGVVYLTEDERDGCFYRFRPHHPRDLGAGVLDVLVGPASASVSVRWVPVPDPDARSRPTRHQVPGATRFDGGEGCWYAQDRCYFTTKGDNRVWAYDAAKQRLELVYDDSLVAEGEAPLRGVDNIIGSAGRDLYVAEDGDDMEINLITPDGVVTPFAQVYDHHPKSEIAGPAFSPDGTRLYFSSQRGKSGKHSGGVTFEVTGPFRR